MEMIIIMCIYLMTVEIIENVDKISESRMIHFFYFLSEFHQFLKHPYSNMLNHFNYKVKKVLNP